jgi:vesicle-fusing ATPase
MTIGLGNLHRQAASLRLGVEVPVRVWKANPGDVAASISMELSYIGRGDMAGTVLDVAALAKDIKSKLHNHVFSVGQKSAVQFSVDTTRSVPLMLTVTAIEHVDMDDAESSKTAALGLGQLVTTTELNFSKASDATFRLKGGSATRKPHLFGKGFNFAALGIGGLDAEFQDIFRKAFASRLLPAGVVEKMGLNHVRGMLLFGPPGCGKTLIARQIGKALHAREPKVVNGPEVLNKYVGQSEENIRKLFEDAEKEQAERGDESDLHIIIFDEIDAICRRRGTTGGGTGVNDSIVNQLLSKLDGVEALNNILVIGMTNRKDMIDSAVLRPGRLEVHVEISLPDEHGRSQILSIHTAKMRENGFLDPGVSIPTIASLTKNYTGAELEGLVKTARSYAVARVVDPTDLTRALDTRAIKVTQADFLMAVEETEAAFGTKEEELSRHCQGGIISFGPEFEGVVTALRRLIRQSLASDRSPLLTACVCGPHGAGKSALSVKLALDSGFPFVKRLGADDMLGMTELDKVRTLHEAFEDAYKSSQSLLILDDVERMIEYVPIGPRFSNSVLQALLVLLRRVPPKDGRRLLVMVTSAEEAFLRDVGMLATFTVLERLPMVTTAAHFHAMLSEIAADVMDPAEMSKAASALAGQRFPVKRVVQVVELAKQAARDESGAEASASTSAAAASTAPIVLTADQLMECAADHMEGVIETARSLDDES